jgi:hypothetical protein
VFWFVWLELPPAFRKLLSLSSTEAMSVVPVVVELPVAAVVSLPVSELLPVLLPVATVFPVDVLVPVVPVFELLLPDVFWLPVCEVFPVVVCSDDCVRSVSFPSTAPSKSPTPDSGLETS